MADNDRGRGVLEVAGLRHRYPGGFVLEVERLVLRPGEVTALIGPNGAGKTTLLRLLAGLLDPGRATLRLGEEPLPAVVGAGRLALFLDTFPPRTALTPVAWLRLLARLRGRELFPDEAREWLARHGVGHVAERRFGKMSSGERRRTMLALVTWGDPRVVLLDEPLAGLDPTSVMDWRERIRDLAAGERVVVVSSHALLELERIADSFVFLRGGRVARTATRTELEAGATVRLVVAASREEVAPFLASWDVVAVRETGGRTVIELDRRNCPPFADLVIRLREGGIEVLGGGAAEVDLEGAFRAVTDEDGGE